MKGPLAELNLLSYSGRSISRHSRTYHIVNQVAFMISYIGLWGGGSPLVVPFGLEIEQRSLCRLSKGFATFSAPYVDSQYDGR